MKTEVEMLQEVITMSEASELFSVHYQTLMSAVKERRLSPIRQSGTIWLTTKTTIRTAIQEGRLKGELDE